MATVQSPRRAPRCDFGLGDLPEEVLGIVYLQLSGRELARVLLTSRKSPLVLNAARARLRLLDPTCACSRGWPLALASSEALASSVGQRPAALDWVAEWDALAKMHLQDGGALLRIETLLCKSALAAELRHGVRGRESNRSHRRGALRPPSRGACRRRHFVPMHRRAPRAAQLGWPLEDAQAAALLCTFFRRPLARMLLGDVVCTAPCSQWMLREALLAAAQRQTARGVPVSRCHAVLCGPLSSLCAQDRSWDALAGGEVPSVPFRTHGSAVAYAVAERCPGWAAASTAVRFEGRPAGKGGYRSLIELGSGQYVLPPLAWVQA
eukprot:4460791-Prymnesium_polylepis.1